MNRTTFEKIGKRCFLSLLIFTFVPYAEAQRVALKTNALYWATLSPNIGAEFRLSRHFTTEIDMMCNPNKIGNLKLHFIGVEGEGRYWFSRTMIRNFIGIMAEGISHDLTIKKTNHYGDVWALGLTYGHVWAISKRFNFEASFGAGLIHYRDKEWDDGETEPASPNHSKTMLAPIKASLSICYILK